jgi:hypothetical protein
MFNGRERPITSIRHMGIQRMESDGVQDVHEIYNTSKDMVRKHYSAESDERSIVRDFNKTYAKRLKILK